MKKLSAVLICSVLLFSAVGCGTRDKLKELVNSGDPETLEEVSPAPRVYMDEIRGTVKDFTGNHLFIQKDETTYDFDVSQADLECQGGIITGDMINVIYEGRLNGTDTSTVKALKVVDSYHNKTELKEKKTYGQVQGLTENTITLKSRSGKVASYPITGTEQYYQNGIRAGSWVYLHFRGNFGEPLSDDPNLLNARHLKVLSVSDIDPMKVPEPTPTPAPQDQKEQQKEQQLRGVIRGVNMNTLQVSPVHSDTVLKLDMSSVPCHFSGGLSSGSHVKITYTGKFNGTSTEGISILGITGEIPEQLKKSGVSFTVSGEITSSTANTITILSYDGMSLTFLTDTASNSSTGGLLTGSNVKLTFNPADSRASNIYTCLKIEDA